MGWSTGGHRGDAGGREQNARPPDLDRGGGDHTPDQSGDHNGGDHSEPEDMLGPDDAQGLIELIGIADLGQSLGTKEGRIHGVVYSTG